MNYYFRFKRWHDPKFLLAVIGVGLAVLLVLLFIFLPRAPERPPVDGEVRHVGQYTYTYSEARGGWKAALAVDRTRTRYKPVAATLGGKPVNDLSRLYMNCTVLTDLPVIPSGVTNLSGMLYGCSALSVLDVSGWDTSCVTDMSYLFCGVGVAAKGDTVITGLEHFDTSRVTTLCGTFANGESHTATGKITSASLAGIAGWDTSHVTDLTCTFYGQGRALTELDLSRWDVSSVRSLNHTFCDCNLLESLDLSGWDVGEVRTMENMFDDCFALTTIGDVSGWDVGNLLDLGGFLNGCSSFVGTEGKLDLSGWTTSSLRGADEAFRAIAVHTLDLSHFDTRQIDNTPYEGAGEGIFYEYSTGLSVMFKDCATLTQITVGENFVTDVADCTDMFLGCGVDHVTYTE